MSRLILPSFFLILASPSPACPIHVSSAGSDVSPDVRTAKWAGAISDVSSDVSRDVSRDVSVLAGDGRCAETEELKCNPGFRRSFSAVSGREPLTSLRFQRGQYALLLGPVCTVSLGKGWWWRGGYGRGAGGKGRV